MNRLSIAVLLLSSASLAASAAHATDQIRTETQFSVSTAHVNFAKPEEVKALYTKLKIFAQLACGSDFSDPLTFNADKACETIAVSDAVHQIGRVELSRLDETTSRRSPTPAMVLTSNDR